jgi:hypothetical protein
MSGGIAEGKAERVDVAIIQRNADSVLVKAALSHLAMRLLLKVSRVFVLAERSGSRAPRPP